MAAINVTLSGVDEVIRRLNQYPEKIQKEVGAELKLAAQEVRRLAIKDAPANNGRLRNSIIVDQDGPLHHLTAVQNSYAAYQEWGTKSKIKIPAEITAYAAQFKGKSSSNEGGSLRLAIEAWVKRKGIGMSRSGPAMRRRGQGARDKANQKSIAFLIARKIAKEGIKPHPFFFKNVFFVRDKLKTRILTIIKGIKI